MSLQVLKHHLPTVLMESSGLWLALIGWKEEWKFASAMLGEVCVMMPSALRMLKLFADKWENHSMVGTFFLGLPLENTPVDTFKRVYMYIRRLLSYTCILFHFSLVVLQKSFTSGCIYLDHTVCVLYRKYQVLN